MCNQYRLDADIAAISGLTGTARWRAVNLPPTLEAFPDTAAPVVRAGADGVRELARLRWGMPTPAAYLKSAHDPGVTNVRNTDSPHWRDWLGVENRCLVPATAFSEYGVDRDPVTGRRPLHWFARTQAQPVFAFAGIWTNWHGRRKAREAAQDHEVFAILTCAPNGPVGGARPKSMPAILTTPAEAEVWLTAPWPQARRLQRPLPDDALTMLDGGAAAPAPAPAMRDLFAAL